MATTSRRWPAHAPGRWTSSSTRSDPCVTTRAWPGSPGSRFAQRRRSATNASGGNRAGAPSEQAALDRVRGAGLGRLGHRLLRRRRARARVDAVRAVGALPACGRASGRPAVRGRRARHVRLPRRSVEPVGAAVALPRGDRRRARQGREGARDLRVPLPGGRVELRALPRAQDDLPARLSRRLRVPDRPCCRSRGAGTARARRASCPSSRATEPRCFALCARRSRPRRCLSGPA